jgi:hypothetical protein
MGTQVKNKWTIRLTEEAKATLKSGVLTADDMTVITEWERTVREEGPDALQFKPSVWADHELKGEWEGCRASSFSYKGRIIYYVSLDYANVVLVMKITAEHDYTKLEDR